MYPKNKKSQLFSSFIIAILLMGPIHFSQAQNKIIDFFKLSVHEKTWVAFHPFIAKKAWNITNYARQVTGSVKSDTVLGKNENGGQLDAFRHAFWMANLSREIKYKKAYKLGRAHERKNKADYRKNKYEEGKLPDAISCKMDLLNNKIGLNLGIENPEISNTELRQLIIEKIIAGDMWIIKTDRQGNYLDEYDSILQQSDYQGKWNNSKCLVKSNFYK
ncbi:MAG: hypothetical protein GXO79_09565 [Chlorobi bacterium]|nr:hypothetical protein [Chlorobiota bacterium]